MRSLVNVVENRSQNHAATTYRLHANELLFKGGGGMT